MFEKYYVPVLSYLLERKNIDTNPDVLEIDGIPNSVIQSIISELDTLKYTQGGKQHIWITEKGEAYLFLHSNNELPKSEPNINIRIGSHDITGNVSYSDLSTDSLNHSIAPPTNMQQRQIKASWIKSRLTWIRQNVWKFIIEVAIGLAILIVAKYYLIK